MGLQTRRKGLRRAGRLLRTLPRAEGGQARVHVGRTVYDLCPYGICIVFGLWWHAVSEQEVWAGRLHDAEDQQNMRSVIFSDALSRTYDPCMDWPRPHSKCEYTYCHPGDMNGAKVFSLWPMVHNLWPITYGPHLCPVTFSFRDLWPVPYGR